MGVILHIEYELQTALCVDLLDSKLCGSLDRITVHGRRSGQRSRAADLDRTGFPTGFSALCAAAGRTQNQHRRRRNSSNSSAKHCILHNLLLLLH